MYNSRSFEVFRNLRYSPDLKMNYTYESYDDSFYSSENESSEFSEEFILPNGSVSTPAPMEPITDLRLLMTLQHENSVKILEVNSLVLETTKDIRSVVGSLATMREYVDKKILEVREDCRRDIRSLGDRFLRLEASVRQNQAFDNTSSRNDSRVGDTRPECSSGELPVQNPSRVTAMRSVIRKQCRYCGKLLAKSYVREHERHRCKHRNPIE